MSGLTALYDAALTINLKKLLEYLKYISKNVDSAIKCLIVIKSNFHKICSDRRIDGCVNSLDKIEITLRNHKLFLDKKIKEIRYRGDTFIGVGKELTPPEFIMVLYGNIKMILDMVVGRRDSLKFIKKSLETKKVRFDENTIEPNKPNELVELVELEEQVEPPKKNPRLN